MFLDPIAIVSNDSQHAVVHESLEHPSFFIPMRYASQFVRESTQGILAEQRPGLMSYDS